MKINSYRGVLATCVLGSAFLASAAWGQAVIQSGDVKLGVRADGALNVDDPSALEFGGTGLTFVPNGSDALTPGCWCEAWGVADQVSSRFGSTGAASGTQNIVVDSFTSTASTATSVVRVADATGDLFRVTHAFSPSSSGSLYRVDVTIENISVAATTVLYRRAMDWDVYPDRFNELTTVNAGTSPKVVFTSDDGFAGGNPLSGQTTILFSGNAVDSGPADHGALFDFNFGSVAPGESVTFTIFYGAAANQSAAMSALGAVGAEAYSLGKPNPAFDGAGPEDGAPNTYIFAFAGVGGTPIGGGTAGVAAVPVGGPLGLAWLAALLAAAGGGALRRRQR